MHVWAWIMERNRCGIYYHWIDRKHETFTSPEIIRNVGFLVVYECCWRKALSRIKFFSGSALERVSSRQRKKWSRLRDIQIVSSVGPTFNKAKANKTILSDWWERSKRLALSQSLRKLPQNSWKRFRLNGKRENPLCLPASFELTFHNQFPSSWWFRISDFHFLYSLCALTTSLKYHRLAYTRRKQRESHAKRLRQCLWKIW